MHVECQPDDTDDAREYQCNYDVNACSKKSSCTTLCEIGSCLGQGTICEKNQDDVFYESTTFVGIMCGVGAVVLIGLVGLFYWRRRVGEKDAKPTGESLGEKLMS
jgi:hypothetical protein